MTVFSTRLRAPRGRSATAERNSTPAVPSGAPIRAPNFTHPNPRSQSSIASRPGTNCPWNTLARRSDRQADAPPRLTLGARETSQRSHLLSTAVTASICDKITAIARCASSHICQIRRPQPGRGSVRAGYCPCDACVWQDASARRSRRREARRQTRQKQLGRLIWACRCAFRAQRHGSIRAACHASFSAACSDGSPDGHHQVDDHRQPQPPQ